MNALKTTFILVFALQIQQSSFGAQNEPENNTGFINKGDTVYKKGIETPVGTSGLLKIVDFHGKRYYVCEVDPHKYKVEAFNRLDNESHEAYSFTSLINVKKKDLIFAMNGGMYEQDLSPVGLFISEGKTYRTINLKKTGAGNFYALQPGGVFFIDSNDVPRVLTTDMYSGGDYKTKLATQSGPMLLVNGLINVNFQANSKNFNIRNGVGTNKNNNIVFAISAEPVNFYEFAQLFKSQLGCSNALYLDGAISQIYAPDLQGGAPTTGAPLGVFVTVSKRGK